MATTVGQSDPRSQQYSCKCLNVRIRVATTQTLAPESADNPEYTKVYVGEEGISITHPQVTLRTRSRGTPINGTSRCSRFTTLTCLICEVLAYRVHQVISLDVEGKDGPVLPTDEWVEDEIMKSTSGWIEVHKTTLNGDAIGGAEASPAYSTIFNIVLPVPTPSPPPMTIEPASGLSPSTPSPAPASQTPISYLSNMKPLFPPHPFTPSHPVFLHLSSLASAKSQALRSSTEQYIADVVRGKVAEIESAEDELRNHVETLWKKFRESLNSVEHERGRVHLRRPSTSRSRERSIFQGVGSPSYGTPVAIRDFVPVAVPVARSAAPRHAPRHSALSASLATSSFHHPRARTGRISPPPTPPTSAIPANGLFGSGSSRTLSSESGSRTLNVSPPDEGSNVFQFKRNTDDTVNTTASFRYFVNLEEDIARHRRSQQKDAKFHHGTDQTQQAGPSQMAPSPNTNGNETHNKKRLEFQSRAEDSASGTQRSDDERSQSRGRDKGKGKRRVTFDVQPAVVTIKREVNAEKEEEAALANQDTGEMIFDLEDEGSERSFNSRPTLPLIEQPAIFRPLALRKPRAQKAPGLPGSFSALRPASLPVPSHIRPVRSQHGVDSSSSQAIMMSLPRPPPPISQTGHRRSVSMQSPSSTRLVFPEEPPNPRDEEILKLVAANTPSHRGAWKPDSKAWQTFVRRQDTKDITGTGNIPEEGEDGADSLGLGLIEVDQSRPAYEDEDDSDDDDGTIPIRANFVGSLPIPIGTLSRLRPVLTLASYQPKTSLAERPGILVPPLPQRGMSSSALRKAAYAERDLSRSMDPGALDFATDEIDSNEDDESDDEVLQGVATESGGRGRKRALKILQARSEIPEAGMWRSLAS